MFEMTKTDDGKIEVQADGQQAVRVDPREILGALAGICREMGINVQQIATPDDVEYRGVVRPITSVAIISEPA